MSNLNYKTSIVGCILFALFNLLCISSYAQDLTRKLISSNDYSLWGNLRTQAFSNDGEWVSYVISYGHSDTLYVKNTRTLNTHKFPESLVGKFIGSGKFACIDKNAKLTVTTLKTGKRWQIDNVLNFQGRQGLKFITLAVTKKDNQKILMVLDESGKELTLLQNIGEYHLSNMGNNILYSAVINDRFSVGILDLQNYKKRTLIVSDKLSAKKFTWSSDGKSVAFMSKGSNKSDDEIELHHFQLSNGRHSVMREKDHVMPIGSSFVYDNNSLKISINTAGNKLFFGLYPRAEKASVLPKNVEIWDASDKLLYPMRSAIALNNVKQSQLAVWNISTSRVYLLGKGSSDFVKLIDNEKYALTSESISRFSKVYPARNYYLTDTENGKTQLVLDSLSGNSYGVSPSPNGNYIAYFKEGNWWVYNTKLGQHINCTKNQTAIWDNSQMDPNNTREILGKAGWSKDGRFLVYDMTDLWAIDPISTKTSRITKGKEVGLKFRIADTHPQGEDFNYSDSREIDLNQELIFSCRDLNKNDQWFTLRGFDGKMNAISARNRFVERLFTSENSAVVIYEEQAFDLPPSIVLKNIKSGKERLITQSNSHHFNYAWGKAEVISYKVGDTILKAAVFYPPNYNKEVKYPTITYVYENLSQEAYKYINPSNSSSIGFNIANLVSKGYILLLPDIIYKEKSPGKYVVMCVSAAVEKLIATGRADPNKIGIYGHSFGGYETNLLLTRTKLFAVGATGGAISDPITGYLNYQNTAGIMEYWRYEDQQIRIDTPLYEDKLRYLENSPLWMADKITTPLFSWAGKNDPVVNSHQSMLLYSALRRLKRDHIMVLYPNEGHTLFNPANQADLTQKVESWFGYYLKNEKPENWMSNGMRDKKTN